MSAWSTLSAACDTETSHLTDYFFNMDINTVLAEGFVVIQLEIHGTVKSQCMKNLVFLPISDHY